ncbi:MAG: spore cortex biosynthesis protein YabQ [Tissierellia bacterium]|nr:spore cortex biosynthesis protein YabQ [Tissierellia bacterium]
MDTTIKVQFYIFLTSLYGGLIAGLAYDIYRVSRYYFKPRKIVTSIEDLLFWIGLALIFFYILNKGNWGELRGYIFIGFSIGGFIYIKFLSKILFPLWVKLFNWIGFAFKGIIKLIGFPIKQIKKLLLPKAKRLAKIKRIPREAIREINRYRKIISNKK